MSLQPKSLSPSSLPQSHHPLQQQLQQQQQQQQPQPTQQQQPQPHKPQQQQQSKALSEVDPQSMGSALLHAASSPKPAALPNNDGRAPTPRGSRTPNHHTSLPNHASSASSPPDASPAAAPHLPQPQSQSQLALMLANALADADALRRDLAVAQARAARAERLLSTFQGVPGSPSNAASGSTDGLGPQTSKDREAKEGESHRLPENAVKVILAAETRAERAERAHADLAASLSTLSVQFADLERYEHACSLRAADALASFSRILSGVAHSQSAYANYSPKLSVLCANSAASPGRDQPESLSLPPLPLPHSAASPTSNVPVPGASSAGSAALLPSSSRYSRTLPGYAANTPHTYSTHAQGHVRQNSSNAPPFFALPLPPPPSAAGLSTTAMGSVLVPAKRGHRSRSSRMDDPYADREQDEKRRRVGTWDADTDPAVSPLQHAYSHASSNYSHHNLPLSAVPTMPHTSSRTFDSQSTITNILPNSSSWAPSSAAALSHSQQSSHLRERELAAAPPPPPHSHVTASLSSKYDPHSHVQHAHARSGSSSTRQQPMLDDVRDIRDIRVDARELVRDAKERERRGREAAVAVRAGDYYSDRDARHHVHVHSNSRHGETNRTGGSRRRSLSRGSVESSWSIDEMLLETATDRERDRERDCEERKRRGEGVQREPSALQHYQSHVFTPPVTGAPAKKPPSQASSGNSANGDSSRFANGSTTANAPVNANGSAVASSNSNVHATATTAASSNASKSAAVPANQLVTLGPGGMVISGGAMPGGGFPAQNAQGQRICRQCGVAGRYKDGKCVEKWGPGPEGPGTVCDRCRKKMKRVERRGTIDAAAASANAQAQVLARGHAGSGSGSGSGTQLLAQQQHTASPASLTAMQSAIAQQGRSRGGGLPANGGSAVGSAVNYAAAMRQDTVLIDQGSRGQMASSSSSHLAAGSGRIGSTADSAASAATQLHYREHREHESGSSRSHSGSPASQEKSYGSVASLPQQLPHHLPSGTAMSSTAGGTGTGAGTVTQSQTLSQNHRRPPTPPYITSISTREQYANGNGGAASGTGTARPSHGLQAHAHSQAHAPHSRAPTHHANTHAHAPGAGLSSGSRASHSHSRPQSNSNSNTGSISGSGSASDSSRGTSVNEDDDLLDGDAEDDVMLGHGNGNRETSGAVEADGDGDNEIDGDADMDLDVDAELARAAIGLTPTASPSPRQHPHLHSHSLHKTAASASASAPSSVRRSSADDMSEFSSAANARMGHSGPMSRYHYRDDAIGAGNRNNNTSSMIKINVNAAHNQKRVHVALPGVASMEALSEPRPLSQLQHRINLSDDADGEGDGDGDGDADSDVDAKVALTKGEGVMGGEFGKPFDAVKASATTGAVAGVNSGASVSVGGMKMEE